MSFGASTESVWKAKRNGRTLLETVRATELTSALNVPPQILSSHDIATGTRSEMKVHLF